MPKLSGEFVGADASSVQLLEGKHIDGISLEDDKSTKRMLKLIGSYNHSPKDIIFPVNWPVSLDKSNIKRLETEQFVIAPKPDGPRFLLYVDSDGKTFLLNNTHRVFKLEQSHAFKRIPADTVLDGVVVVSKIVPSEAAQNAGKPTFVIMDATLVNGKDLTQMGIRERISAVKTRIMQPRSDGIKKKCIDTDLEIFELDILSYQPLSSMEKYLGQGFKNEYMYPLRTFVFYPLVGNYSCGSRRKRILQWNEYNEQNFSFRLKIATSREGQSTGELHVVGPEQKEMQFKSIELTDELMTMDGSIIECRYTDRRNWNFVRVRTDRKLPNGLHTITSKLESLKDPVTRDMLLSVKKFTGSGRGDQVDDFLLESPDFPNLGFTKKREFPGEFVGIDENVTFLENKNLDGIRLSRNFNFVRAFQTKLGNLNQGSGNKFPATSPISLHKDNMKQLKTEQFVAAPKPEGIRYLLYVDPDGRMFLEQDKTQHVFIVDPDRAPQAIPRDTILDGIVVKKIVRAGEAASNSNSADVEGKVTFVIMDATRVNGVDLIPMTILDRISFVMDEIMRYQSPSFKMEGDVEEAFDMDITRFEESVNMQQYLTRAFKDSYQYPLRSFVFNPVVGSYSCGGEGCRIYQWDESIEVECAFRLKMGFWAELYVTDPMENEVLYESTIQWTGALNGFNGQIIDCRFRDNRWIFVRVREDRNQPDSLRWISGKLETLKKQVTLQELLASLNNAG